MKTKQLFKALIFLSVTFFLAGNISAQEEKEVKNQKKIKIVAKGESGIDTTIFLEEGMSDKEIQKIISDITGKKIIVGSAFDKNIHLDVDSVLHGKHIQIFSGKDGKKTFTFSADSVFEKHLDLKDLDFNVVVSGDFKDHEYIYKNVDSIGIDIEKIMDSIKVSCIKGETGFKIFSKDGNIFINKDISDSIHDVIKKNVFIKSVSEDSLKRHGMVWYDNDIKKDIIITELDGDSIITITAKDIDIDSLLKEHGLNVILNEGGKKGVIKIDGGAIAVMSNRMAVSSSAHVEIKEADKKFKVITKDGETINVYVSKDSDGKNIVKNIMYTITISDINKDDEKKLKSSIGITPDNLKVKDLSYYPNPNHGKFNLEFNLDSDETIGIEVYDLSGKKVYERLVEAFTGEFKGEVDLSDVGQGIYILKISQAGKTLSKKIIVE